MMGLIYRRELTTKREIKDTVKHAPYGEDILQRLRPLLHIGRLSGVFPVSFAPRRLTLSWWWAAYSSLVLPLVAYIAYFTYNSNYVVVSSINRAPFFMNAMRMGVIMWLFGVFMLYGQNLVFIRTVVTAANRVGSYERAHPAVGPSLKTIARVALLSWVAQFVLYSLHYALNAAFLILLGIPQWPTFIVVAILCSWLAIASELIFISQALLLSRHLAALVTELHSLCAQYRPLPSVAQVRFLRRRHLYLYTTSCIIVEGHGFQLVTLVSTLFGQCIINLFFAFSIDFSFLTPSVFFVSSTYVLRLAALMLPSEHSTQQTNNQIEAIHKLLDRSDLYVETRQELREYLTQLTQLETKFSAIGYFPLDFSQLQRVIASVTTYLVILLQFQFQTEL